MIIHDYYTLSGESLQFSQAQASEFAKSVAGDFNPLHDVGAKRFCVPGDLLFSVLLNRYGVFSSMQVSFEGMLSADVPINLPVSIEKTLELRDSEDRLYLGMSVSGEHIQNADVVAALTKEYVQFSGKTFPDILVDLMRREGVMINASRPLVIYSDMALDLTSIDITKPILKLSGSSLAVDGKKGKATLSFDLLENGAIVGHGEKNMILGGLREFDEAAVTGIVEQYRQWQNAYPAVENA
jgi:hypothetical protein